MKLSFTFTTLLSLVFVVFGVAGNAQQSSTFSTIPDPDEYVEPSSEAEIVETAEAVETAAADNAELSAALTTLDLCQSELMQLATMITSCSAPVAPAPSAQSLAEVEGLRAQLAERQEDFDTCTNQVRLERSTNFSLVNERDECLLATQQAPVVDPQQVTALEAQLAEAALQFGNIQEQLQRRDQEFAALEAENDLLAARILELGATLAPGFAYYGGNPEASFIIVSSLGEVDRNNRLPASQCDDAITWLNAGADGQPWWNLQLWVWERDEALLCILDDAGLGALSSPSPTTSAHVVLYR